MHIRVFQSGGFAGERIQLKEISDQQLSPEKRPLLQVLLNKADAYYATKSRKHNGEIGADQLQYEIEIPDPQSTHVYKFTNTPSDQPLTDLMNFIMNL
jgi:hypothetical protein